MLGVMQTITVRSPNCLGFLNLGDNFYLNIVNIMDFM